MHSQWSTALEMMAGPVLVLVVVLVVVLLPQRQMKD
jgi:ABC-type glycerol-3-phosphate transport system permease component